MQEVTFETVHSANKSETHTSSQRKLAKTVNDVLVERFVKNCEETTDLILDIIQVT